MTLYLVVFRAGTIGRSEDFSAGRRPSIFAQGLDTRFHPPWPQHDAYVRLLRGKFSWLAGAFLSLILINVSAIEARLENRIP